MISIDSARAEDWIKTNTELKLEVPSNFCIDTSYEIQGAFKIEEIIEISVPSSFETMLASERILRRYWDTPDEDEVWEDL